jgi:hypothetical protein
LFARRLGNFQRSEAASPPPSPFSSISYSFFLSNSHQKQQQQQQNRIVIWACSIGHGKWLRKWQMEVR